MAVELSDTNRGGLSEPVNRGKTDNTRDKRTNNDLQNTTQKTKDRAI
jgi:hypothetical protein